MTRSVEFTAPRNGSPEEYSLSVQRIVNLGRECVQEHKVEYFTLTSSWRYEDPLHTLDITAELADKIGVPVIPHIRSNSLEPSDFDTLVTYAHNSGTDLVIISGEKSRGVSAPPFPTALDLVHALKRELSTEDSRIHVGCYPQGFAAETIEEGIDFLGKKVQAGAGLCVSQFYFSDQLFAKFYECYTKAQLGVPLAVGIMPINSAEQIAKAAQNCGVQGWEHLAQELAPLTVQEQVAMGNSQIANMLNNLENLGIDHYHFYSLNRASLLLPLLESL